MVPNVWMKWFGTLIAVVVLASVASTHVTAGPPAPLSNDNCEMGGADVQPSTWQWAYATELFAVEVEYMTQYDSTWQFIRSVSDTTTANAIYAEKAALAPELSRIANTPPSSALPGGDGTYRVILAAGRSNSVATAAKNAAMQRISALFGFGC